MSTQDQNGHRNYLGATAAEQQAAGVPAGADASLAISMVEQRRQQDAANLETYFANKEAQAAAGYTMLNLDRLFVLAVLYGLFFFCAYGFVYSWIEPSTFETKLTLMQRVYWIIGFVVSWKFLSWLRRVWR